MKMLDREVLTSGAGGTGANSQCWRCWQQQQEWRYVGTNGCLKWQQFIGLLVAVVDVFA